MIKDLRHGIRVLVQAKAWTSVVVISLALGIGANTALFSVLNGLLLTKVPVADPDSLVRFRWAGKNDMVTSSSDYGFLKKAADGQNVRSTFSYPMFRQFVADNRTLADLFACAPNGRVNLVVEGQADLASAFLSSGNYYRMLGVSARLGRVITPEDDQPSAPPVAVISSKLWHTRFGSDPSVVGRVVRANNVPITIIGVLPAAFTGIQQPIAELPDIAMPLSVQPQIDADPESRLTQPTYWWLQVMGRLKPGATAAQVRGNLEGVFQATARAGLDSYLKGLTDAERQNSNNRNRSEVPRLLVEPGARGIYDVNTNDLRGVTILTAVVALVLLIVCANVANLLLSRAATRHKEISVRLSLGATRGRLIRQLLTESLLLAFTGGALGVFVGYWGQQLLPGPPGQIARLDWRMFGFVFLISGMTGVIFGIAPAWRGTAMHVSSALKESGRSVIGSRSFLSKALLIVQVAVSLVLLVGAGLFLQTLQNLRQVDVGFNPQNLLLFRVNASLNRYDEARVSALYRDMLERIATVPGVRAAAMSQPALLSGSVNSTSFFVQGRVYPAGRQTGDANSINRLVISPNFFEVMGIPVVMGRALTDRDTSSAPKVAVINEAAARKFFPGENPIGHKFGSSVETTRQLEIVGILHDAKYDSVRDSAPPTMYVPYTQTRVGSATFEVRTAGLPSAAMTAVREAVRQLDPNLPLTDVSTQIEQVERRFQQERVFALAYALFGGLAMLLAAIGLFGLMSYSVARRTNEIGIRMALGAQRTDVLRLVLGESMALVGVGIVVGVALALATGRFITAMLYGLGVRDAKTLTAAIVSMVLVSAVAGYLPARRAAQVDPMVALRWE